MATVYERSPVVSTPNRRLRLVDVGKKNYENYLCQKRKHTRFSLSCCISKIRSISLDYVNLGILFIYYMFVLLYERLIDDES